MQSVKKPVEKWQDQDTGNTYKYETGEESITRCKQLCSIRSQGIYRSHPTQYHRRIEKCVNPLQPGEVVIAGNADSKRSSDCNQRDRKVEKHSLHKLMRI